MMQAVEESPFLTSHHAERTVLGGMLVEPLALQDGLEILNPRDFSLDSHRRLFRAIQRVVASGLAVDDTTVADALAKSKELANVGGVVFITGLSDGLPRRISIVSYARLLQESAARRRILAMCESVREDVAAGVDPLKLLGDLQAMANEEESADTALRPVPISEALPAYLQALKERRESTQKLPGITTGLAALDKVTGGWRKGHLVYVGGLPGRGKSAVMTQFAYAAALDGVPCGYVSLEMTQHELLARLATIHSGLGPGKYPDAATMSDSEWEQATYSAIGPNGLGDLPIELTDLGGLRVAQVATIVRRMQANGAQMVVVDFLQTIQHEGRDIRESINTASATLRETARKLGITILVGSQLARRDPGKPNKRPTMQDLRESGNLEQDAHLVLLLYRPQESPSDGVDEEEKAPEFNGLDEIIIAKQRNGVTGSVLVEYDDASLTFKPRGFYKR